MNNASRTFRMVAGVDEVGRGPLAGPVVAAAVVLDARRPIAGLRDSKALSEPRRVALAREVRRHALGFAVGFATVEEIDRLNILQASLLAMERAVARLPITPDVILVDGNRAPAFANLPGWVTVEAIVRGDATVPAISAASIVGKVCRDRLLRRMHRRFPQYDFASNKGYPTAAHLQALEQFGVTEVHRMSFAPVRRIVSEGSA
jgi:ribonuclease HII